MRWSKDGLSTHLQRSLGMALLAGTMALSAPTFADQSALTSPHDTGARFTVLGEYNREAVLDNKTGLVWEQSPALDIADWDMAQRRCLSNHAGGGPGWRVPTVQELLTLVEPSSIEVKLPPDHPFANVEPAIYWSATQRGDDRAYASFVNFGNGRSATLEKYMPSFVWCVHGNQ
ncbi:MAG TPA: DUF1566 domain-containing protein [Nitrospira sp.]|nr:DUF1566 domain-containing protein [Nitrospira sp.]